ncbi:hypothetical protein SAMN02194393_01428 [Maledivibacter halophilus]|uniref:Uncharacterized protein n=2 Tax=Maledivibacter halophilus TaxID=36842 RepID=A0A1T5JXB6_9FIRM|nr:hypothetical protein SAMN02194393_01428 [Maledivibacter halophilus]
MSFHPSINMISVSERYPQLAGFISNVKIKDLNEEINVHIINDEVLDNFLRYYSNKSISDFEIHDKEEIRYILESMGKYNTKKLKKLLMNNSIKKEREIYKILRENLFDEQLTLLNEMLSKK